MSLLFTKEQSFCDFRPWYGVNCSLTFDIDGSYDMYFSYTAFKPASEKHILYYIRTILFRGDLIAWILMNCGIVEDMTAARAEHSYEKY